jgi:transcriptional regulator with XRE-family HTH domain
MSRCVTTIDDSAFERRRSEIAQLRIDANLSQREAATSVGLSERELNDMEHGRLPISEHTLLLLRNLYRKQRAYIDERDGC